MSDVPRQRTADAPGSLPGTRYSELDRSLSEALASAVKLYHDNEYDQLSRILPRLIEDGYEEAPLMRSRILQPAGSVMVQTRQLQPAQTALDRSLADAEAFHFDGGGARVIAFAVGRADMADSPIDH
ncbi:hypothetical protein [Nocardia amamiensis]|uniref:hypothetical protein n=1 Tax=Nocardia amamiensis TaxID=404578 RepID=UPI0012F4C813|nr:hypothetical protein [Nocardia amamiensis]